MVESTRVKSLSVFCFFRGGIVVRSVTSCAEVTGIGAYESVSAWLFSFFWVFWVPSDGARILRDFSTI